MSILKTCYERINSGFHSYNVTGLLQECEVDPGGLSQAHQLPHILSRLIWVLSHDTNLLL